jgi:hypothetical protein
MSQVLSSPNWFFISLSGEWVVHNDSDFPYWLVLNAWLAAGGLRPPAVTA